MAVSLLITAILITVTFAPHAYGLNQDAQIEAAPGDLDITFGSAGKTTVNVFSLSAQASALAVQADGKLVAVGNVSTGFGDFALARFNVDGTLDPNFGNGGTVATDFFGSSDSAHAVVIQKDGKIVVAGNASRGGPNNEGYDLAIARYNTNGTLDPSFGVGGKVTGDLSGHTDYGAALALLPDGKLILGGTGLFDSSTEAGDFELVRYNSDGSFDPTFGNGPVPGRAITDFFGHPDFLEAIAVQSDGRILAAGLTYLKPNEGKEQFALARYNADGTLDQTFGSGGKVNTQFPGQIAEANAISLTSNGKIILAGTAFSSQADFALARYNSDGSLDTAFGVGGTVTTDFAGRDDSAEALCIQSDNKILVAGRRMLSSNSDTTDFALARYNADGSLDSGFGSGGKTSTDFSGLGDVAQAMALQSDGKVILGGYSFHPTGPTTSAFEMSLARYTTGGLTAPGFSLSFEESPVTADRGAAVKVHILINRTGGFNGNVTISPPDTSDIGVKVKPPVPLSTTDSTVTFKLKIKAGATVGHFPLTFSGQDDSGHVAAATITLFIQ